jgi:nitrite reductase/ring-hydroxylating ferredoxin subunit
VFGGKAWLVVSDLKTLGIDSASMDSGEIKAWEVDGLKIAVARVGDNLYAFSDTCTHRQCPLSKGHLEDKVVTCPCHGSQFDVTTGAVLNGPAEEPVPTYPVKHTGDVIEVEVDA